MNTASSNPVRCTVEKGAFQRLPEVLSGFCPKRILVVLGGQSFRRSAHFQELERWLAGYEHFFSEPVAANPKAEFIQEEINRLAGQPYDLVLAIGGGSVLDTAKLFAVIPGQTQRELKTYLQNGFELTGPVRPLVALPTTAGTGSEVTPFSSFETGEKKKISMSHPALYPAVALVDPGLCMTMPAYVTACTGFDALSQAIESFWSVNANEESREHSLKGLERILTGFAKVARDPADEGARLAMSKGSCEAGFAIAHARTTAVHSVSYPITAHFNVAHGHACGLTLAEFIRFNAPVLAAEGQPLLKRFGEKDYEGMAASVESLMKTVGLERALSKLGIDQAGEQVILKEGFRPDRVKNNPRPLTVEDLQVILEKIRV